MDDLFSDKLFMYLVTAAMSGSVTGFEWLRYYKPVSTPPILLTIIAGVSIIFCIYKMVKHLHKLKALKLGRSGERAVGQYLELFRESGCHIYHDILGDSFNVDHVVISNKGIFVIETKTYSKPVSGNARITFDGQKILINGSESKSDIITQVTASTSYIKKIINESTGKEFEPFPVVLFPGWFVEGSGNRFGKMWVLEPKAFRSFLDRQTVRLSDDDVKLASYHLSRHIRTF